MTIHALRIAMVLYGDLTFDSRVQREANSLVAAGHSVTIFCLAGSQATAAMLDPKVAIEVVTVGADAGCPTRRARSSTTAGWGGTPRAPRGW